MRKSRAERGFSVALGLFALTLALFLFLQSPFFCLEGIEVSGSSLFSEAEIMAIGGLQHGQNLFDIDIGQLTARLRAEPLVKQVTIKRLLPSRLSVVLVERKPVASILSAGMLWSLDVDVRVLGEVVTPQGLPVIRTPASIDDLVPGMFLEDSLLRAATEVAAALPEILALQVVEMRVNSLRDLELILREGVVVKLGAWRDIDKKMQIVLMVFQQAARRGNALQTIDVRHPEKPVVR